METTGCFVVCSDADAVGAVFSYSYPWQAETLTSIQKLLVSAEHRRKGMASALLNQLGNVKAGLIAKQGRRASLFCDNWDLERESTYMILAVKSHRNRNTRN
ncbi:MAG: GNAT family N-acetyltransferase [Candidatus Thiodiazotropha lotti]|nr:GNAT family N-acetyltransferase [Candidatus Thiodiazotropha lotti]